MRDRVSDKGVAVARKLAEMAAERGLTSAQLALLWVKDQPAVTSPIFGPRTMEQLESFLPVAEMQLSAEDRPFRRIGPPRHRRGRFPQQQ
jgi:1-deoxyxylulose-5-phosphate synthase